MAYTYIFNAHRIITAAEIVAGKTIRGRRNQISKAVSIARDIVAFLAAAYLISIGRRPSDGKEVIPV